MKQSYNERVRFRPEFLFAPLKLFVIIFLNKLSRSSEEDNKKCRWKNDSCKPFISVFMEFRSKIEFTEAKKKKKTESKMNIQMKRFQII